MDFLHLLVIALIIYHLRKGRGSVSKMITRVRSGRRDDPENMTTQYLCSNIEWVVYRAGPQEQVAYDFIYEQALILLISMVLEMLGWTHEDNRDALYKV